MDTEKEWKLHFKKQLAELFDKHLRSWEAFSLALSAKINPADKEQVHRIVEGILMKKLCYIGIDSYLDAFNNYVIKEKINLATRHANISSALKTLQEKNPESDKLHQKLIQINSEESTVAPGGALKISTGKDFVEDNLDRPDHKKGVYSPDFWRLECSPICRKVSLPANTDMGIPTFAAVADPVSGYPSFFVGSNGGGLKRFDINRSGSEKEAGQLEHNRHDDAGWANSLKTVEGLDGVGKGVLLRDRYGFLRMVSINNQGHLNCQDLGDQAAPEAGAKMRYRSTCVLNTGKDLIIAGLRQTEAKLDIIKLGQAPDNLNQAMTAEWLAVEGDTSIGKDPDLIWATNKTSKTAIFYCYNQTDGKLYKIAHNTQQGRTPYSLQAVSKDPLTKGIAGCLMAISHCNTVAVLLPTETGYTVHLFRYKEGDGKHEALSKQGHELKGVGRLEFVGLQYNQGADHVQLFYISRDCHAGTVHLKVADSKEAGGAALFTAIERPDRSTKFSDLYEVVSAKSQSGITASDKVVVLLTHKANYGSEMAIMELSFN